MDISVPGTISDIGKEHRRTSGPIHPKMTISEIVLLPPMMAKRVLFFAGYGKNIIEIT